MKEYEPNSEMTREEWVDNMTQRYASVEGATKPEDVQKIKDWIEGQYIDADEWGYTELWKQHMEDFLKRNNNDK